MKSTYFAAAAAVLVAGSAFAGVQTANQVGRIAVTGVTTNTIIALPFVDIDYPAVTTVTATNYVLTAGLKNGDRLTQKIKNSSGVYEWKGWILTSDGGEWVAVQTESEGGKWSAPEKAVFDRGEALMLTRTDPVASNPFYLLGQVASGSCSVTAAANAVTFIGNPLPRDLSFTDLTAFISNPGNGDKIRVTTGAGGVQTIEWNSDAGKWGFWAPVEKDGKPDLNDWAFTAATAQSATIPAGTGFEYISKGGTPTFNFQ